MGKIAPALGSLEIAARVKDMLLTPPLHRALMGCINTTMTTPTSTLTASGGSAASPGPGLGLAPGHGLGPAPGHGLGPNNEEDTAHHARVQQQEIVDAALCVSLARELLAGAIQMP